MVAVKQLINDSNFQPKYNLNPTSCLGWKMNWKSTFRSQQNHKQNPTTYFGQNETSWKLSFSIRSQPIPDVIFWSEHDVKKTFIFNQIITKPRRHILVRTRRQKNFHFQSDHNQYSTSYFGQNTTSNTFIFNQITTKTRRRILVRTKRQKSFHFQSNHNQYPTSHFGQNATS